MEFGLINIAITAACLVILGLYFSNRERRLTNMADSKFLEIREKYLMQVAQRKAKEKAEIEKIKSLVTRLESKHKKIISQKSDVSGPDITAHAAEIIHQAEKRAKQIEAESKQKADKFLDDQKKDVETKMVDLVMDVTKKVLARSLSYEDQKDLIEKALLEVEGDIET